MAEQLTQSMYATIYHPFFTNNRYCPNVYSAPCIGEFSLLQAFFLNYSPVSAVSPENMCYLCGCQGLPQYHASTPDRPIDEIIVNFNTDIKVSLINPNDNKNHR